MNLTLPSIGLDSRNREMRMRICFRSEEQFHRQVAGDINERIMSRENENCLIDQSHHHHDRRHQGESGRANEGRGSLAERLR